MRARDARAIHGEARREVVAAVEHDVDGRDGGVERGVVEPLRERLDRDVRIQRTQPRRRGVDLELADVVGRVQDLARQIGLVHAVEVVQHEPADTARREELRGRAAEPAEPDDQRAAGREPRLAGLADLGERDLARVALARHLRPLLSARTLRGVLRGACGAPVPTERCARLGRGFSARASTSTRACPARSRMRRDDAPAERPRKLDERRALIVAVLEQQ